MKGTRPLDNTEIRLVSACFDGTYGDAQSRAFYARCEHRGQDLRTAQPNGRGCLAEPASP